MLQWLYWMWYFSQCHRCQASKDQTEFQPKYWVMSIGEIETLFKYLFISSDVSVIELRKKKIFDISPTTSSLSIMLRWQLKMVPEKELEFFFCNVNGEVSTSLYHIHNTKAWLTYSNVFSGKFFFFHRKVRQSMWMTFRLILQRPLQNLAHSQP